jgi:hypothetical protein
MVLGSRDRERFWIALTVRFAFGFLFLIAAINILTLSWSETASLSENIQKVGTSLDSFAAIQSKYYESSWMNVKIDYGAINPTTGASENQLQLGMLVIRYFLFSMPFVFAFLSFLLITGIFYKAALRLSALYLVMLGLGKYVVDFKTGMTLTTLSDFTYAMFICLALFTLSKEQAPARGEEVEEVPVR